MKQALRRFGLWAGWVKPVATDIPTAKVLVPPTMWKYEYQTLYARMGNAGLPVTDTRYEDVRWYVCDEIPTWLMNQVRPLNGAKYHPDTQFAGVWLGKDNSITLVKEYVTDDTVLRHEMVHSLMQNGAHNPAWFTPEFGTDTGRQPV